MIKTAQRERELTIVSQAERLADTRSFVAEVATACGFNESYVFDMQVAVGEAVANAIEHGSPLGEENDIKIICYQDEEALKIEVIDQGEFTKVGPKPDPQLNYRGYGVRLMLALMDKVIIDDTPDGTKVTLIKRYH